MQALQAKPSQEHHNLLSQALAAAKKAGVSADLRVRASKLLNKQRFTQKCQKKTEDEISMLTSQLLRLNKPPEVVGDCSTGSAEEGSSSSQSEQSEGALCEEHDWEVFGRRRRAEQVLNLLKRALERALLCGVCAADNATVQEANTAIASVERQWRAEAKSERRLRGIFGVKDAEAIEDGLAYGREKQEDVGHGAWRLTKQLQDRYDSIVTHEQRLRWLKHELKAATEGVGGPDALRLRQLIDQAKMLNLDVPPNFVTLLHSLETAEPTPRANTARRKARDKLAKLDPHVARCTEATERIVALAEASVEQVAELDAGGVRRAMSELDAAKKSIVNLKQAKVPVDTVTDFERRVAKIELRHGHRLQAEKHLTDLMRVVVPTMEKVDEVVVQGDARLEQLRDAVNEASAYGVTGDILTSAERLLEKSVTVEVERRAAEDMLRQSLDQPVATETSVEQVAEAVQEGRRCGLDTLHAERTLARLREEKMLREAAEAELQEAVKGEGVAGRARLEAAIKAAKCRGVDGTQGLRTATVRLAELQQFEQRCSVLAGNIRRALPTVESQPWRLQTLLESAEKLQPRTVDLERLVAVGKESLQKIVTNQKSQRQAESELKMLLKNLDALLTGSNVGTSKVEIKDALADLLPRARNSSVSEDLLREGERKLKSLRRESCQRTVAQKRLRLAVNAKNLDEIERALREVRALGTASDAGPVNQSDTGPKSSSSKRNRQTEPSSARLMDAAVATLRHLNDDVQRRNAAAQALLAQVSENDGNGDVSFFLGSEQAGDVQSVGGKSTGTNGGVEAWLKDSQELVKEAQQSGVAPSLIEHAKMKIREKRRICQEQVRAVHALDRSMSKKSVSQQELLALVHKVKRFVGQQSS
eukprot:TRINITY_DN38020_c0_g1_i1.p1 TRINITY_DN38020_c0_g1~~TRINITY_DN38020_c0_g1_i1.p1  ORF type:complete len:970 (-),score=215.17 TRINITY_DN38020_c0_g1_i1:64-2691(-)